MHVQRDGWFVAVVGAVVIIDYPKNGTLKSAHCVRSFQGFHLRDCVNASLDQSIGYRVSESIAILFFPY